MKEKLIKQVSMETLEKLHDALISAVEEMQKAEKDQKTRFYDEEYVKCMTLAASVLRAISNKTSK